MHLLARTVEDKGGHLHRGHTIGDHDNIYCYKVSLSQIIMKITDI